jgi:ammonia channel protein AmtB
LSSGAIVSIIVAGIAGVVIVGLLAKQTATNKEFGNNINAATGLAKAIKTGGQKVLNSQVLLILVFILIFIIMLCLHAAY